MRSRFVRAPSTKTTNSMTTVELRSHLMFEVLEQLLEPDLDDPFETEYIKFAGSDDSDSEDDEGSRRRRRSAYDIYQTFEVRRMINCVMSSKTALRNFVQLLRKVASLRFRHSDVFFYLNGRTLAFGCIGSELDSLDAMDESDEMDELESLDEVGDMNVSGPMNAFFKFAKKVSFYELKCGFNEAAVDAFVKKMEGFVDLRHVDMTSFHWVPNEALPKMGNVFANLTDFDVRSDTMVLILKKTVFPFSNLKHLKITEDLEEFVRIVTTAERFPLLDSVDIESENLTGLGTENSKDLVFVENPFPTVKNLNIYIGEEDDSGFTESDIKLVAGWVKKFPSLQKATVSIKKQVHDSDPIRYLALHEAFKSTDFEVPSLELHYTEFGFIGYDPLDEEYEDNFTRFVHVGTFQYETFEYNDSMPGKTFKHTLELDIW